jgi:hypothetical protein
MAKLMPRPRPRPAHLLLLLLVPAVGLATCGGGEDTFRTDRPAVRLKLDEYRISPQKIEARTGRLKFIVRNTGRLPHNLVVQIPAADATTPPVEVGRTDTAQPGESPAPIKLSLRPGTYRLVCTIANHDDLGQYGELRVQG